MASSAGGNGTAIIGQNETQYPNARGIKALLTKEGQTVVAAQIVPVILKLAKLDAMTVKTQISEADVVNVKAGQPVSFTIMGEPDKRYSARLRVGGKSRLMGRTRCLWRSESMEL